MGLVTGWDAMQVQGFPSSWLDDAKARSVLPSSPQLLDIAGNAFSSTSYAAVYIALLASLPMEH